MSVIEDYSFGRIKVDGKTYTSDLIILPDRVIANWWRQSGHSLSLDDLAAVLDSSAEVLVVGTGSAGGLEIPPRVAEGIRNRGLELVVDATPGACQAYNRLAGARRAAGAFHLTC